MKINIFHKKHLAARTLAVILSVVLMGFALSWLFWIDMGGGSVHGHEPAGFGAAGDEYWQLAADSQHGAVRSGPAFREQ